MEKVFEVIRITQETQELKVKHESFARWKVSSPMDVIDFISKLIGDEDREVFLVLVLNTKLEIVAVHRCHIGSLNASIVSPREVFKCAILNNGKNIIVAHNHPSYSTQPSREDIEVTKRLKECGELLGIDVLDHVIVNDKGGISLNEKGLI